MDCERRGHGDLEQLSYMNSRQGFIQADQKSRDQEDQEPSLKISFDIKTAHVLVINMKYS